MFSKLKKSELNSGFFFFDSVFVNFAFEKLVFFFIVREVYLRLNIMYFVILGKNRELSLKELEYAQVEQIEYVQNQKILTFARCDKVKLSDLAGIIKWGKVID